MREKAETDSEAKNKRTKMADKHIEKGATVTNVSRVHRYLFRAGERGEASNVSQTRRGLADALKLFAHFPLGRGVAKRDLAALLDVLRRGQHGENLVVAELEKRVGVALVVGELGRAFAQNVDSLPDLDGVHVGLGEHLALEERDRLVAGNVLRRDQRAEAARGEVHVHLGVLRAQKIKAAKGQNGKDEDPWKENEMGVRKKRVGWTQQKGSYFRTFYLTIAPDARAVGLLLRNGELIALGLVVICHLGGLCCCGLFPLVVLSSGRRLVLGFAQACENACIRRSG